jgi:hypothetical protein
MKMCDCTAGCSLCRSGKRSSFLFEVDSPQRTSLKNDVSFCSEKKCASLQKVVKKRENRHR